MQKIIQITDKIYWACMHIADEKPIESFFHLNISNTCKNSGHSLPMRWILEHKLKRL